MTDLHGGPPTTSVRVFFSYAQRDQSLCDQLENHLSILKYRGLITTWSARKIKAGEDTSQQIDISLSAAHIVLLLISANFLASEYCYSQEMLRAIRRHERGEVHVIPVLLRPVLITDAPFANLKPLPSNQKPVVSWRNRDSAFVDIAIGIERIARQRLDAISPDPYPTTPFSPEEEDWDADPSSPRIPTGALSPWQGQPEEVTPLPYTPAQSSILAGIGRVVQTILLWLRLPLILLQWLSDRHVPKLELQYRRELARLEEQYAQRQREQEESRYRLIEASGLSVPEYEYYEQALQAYEQALDENAIDADAYRGKGHALAALKRHEEALQAFEKSQRHKPLSSTYVGIGDVLAAMERWDEAVAAYQQALALDASSASAYSGLSAALTHLGRTQEAQEASEQARQRGLED